MTLAKSLKPRCQIYLMAQNGFRPLGSLRHMAVVGVLAWTTGWQWWRWILSGVLYPVSPWQLWLWHRVCDMQQWHLQHRSCSGNRVGGRAGGWGGRGPVVVMGDMAGEWPVVISPHTNYCNVHWGPIAWILWQTATLAMFSNFQLPSGWRGSVGRMWFTIYLTPLT